jgi:hypothetical protein
MQVAPALWTPVYFSFGYRRLTVYSILSRQALCRLRVVKYKVDSDKKTVGPSAECQTATLVTQSAVEDPPFAIASDPAESIIIVEPDCRRQRWGPRFGQVDAH